MHTLKTSTVILALACTLVVACDSSGSSGAQAAVAAGAASAAETNLSQSGGQQLPPEVGQWVQAGRQDCIDAGGRFSGAADFIRRGEFNGDGRTDYLLLGGGLDCSVDRGGREGPRNDFLISQSNGGYGLHGGFPAFEVTDEQVVRRNDRDVIALEGTWFRPGGEVHKILWGWNGAEITVVERQDAQGRAVDEDGRLLQVADNRPRSVSGGLPIPEGFYTTYASRNDGSCAAAARNQNAEMEYLYFTREVWREWDGDSPISRITNLGGSRWRLHMYHDYEKDITITGQYTFSQTVRIDLDGLGRYQDETVNYIFCPINTVPSDVRRGVSRPINYEPYEGNG